MSRLEWIVVLVATALAVALALPDWPRTMAARLLNGECWREGGRAIACVTRTLPPPVRPAPRTTET